MQYMLKQSSTDKKWSWYLTCDEGMGGTLVSSTTYNSEGCARRALKVFRDKLKAAPVVVAKASSGDAG